MKTSDHQRPLVIPAAGFCIAGILVLLSIWLSSTLTKRFEEFRNDYTSQQALAAVREVFQFDIGLSRFARSVPMRQESRRFIETGTATELEPLLNVSNAESYNFDFALVFENGSDFVLGYSFEDQRQADLVSEDPLVALVAAAIRERQIVRPTGFVEAFDSQLCMLYACPLRDWSMARRGDRNKGLVLGRWLGRDRMLSANYPEFTLQFLPGSDFDWPDNVVDFDFAAMLRESSALQIPGELLDEEQGRGPGGPEGDGPRGGGSFRGGRGPRFGGPGRMGMGGFPGGPPGRIMEEMFEEYRSIPSALLIGAEFFQAEKAVLDRTDTPRTALVAKVLGVLPEEAIVIQMLLPRNLSDAIDDSIQLVRWTSAFVAVLICLFTFAVVREIHRRRLAEVELVSSNDELRDANEKKDRLLSIIAHDLRAPLAGVVNLAGLMLKAPESFSTEEIRQFAGDIQGTSKQLTELLENLLNWARLQIGKLPYVPVAIDVSKMVHQVATLFASPARQKEIELSVDIAEGQQIVGDQEMLRTVLRNLVGNAVQYTPVGGEVSVRVRETGGFVAIRVKDSGPGLSAERQATLFELPSQPLHADGDGSRGAGFGLVLCKELVERLEGHLAVDSEPEKGTVFTVCIPGRLDVEAHDRLSGD